MDPALITWLVRLTFVTCMAIPLVVLYRRELPYWERESGALGRRRLRWAVVLAPLYVYYLRRQRLRPYGRTDTEGV